MLLFLIAVFLKGPSWLRVIAWMCVAVVLFLGVFLAVNRVRRITERPVPIHAHHTRSISPR